MSSITINANVSVDGSLKDANDNPYIRAGAIVTNFASGLNSEGNLAVAGNDKSITITGSSTSQPGRVSVDDGTYKLQMESQRIGMRTTLNGSVDYGTSGYVLTSGGSSGAVSWEPAGASLSANNTFTGVNTFDEEATFEEAVNLESGATSKSNLVIKDGASNTKLTLSNDGRIGIGSSVNYGTSGQVLTSGGSGELSWTTPSSGSGSGSGSIVASSTAFDPTEDEDTATMKSIRNYLATLIDIEPPVFTGGRFLAVGNQGTSITKVVGDTFDPFTYPVTNVTCTDSPTAGPKKGQTISIPLDWRNFEFRSSLTSGANTVVTHATVFDNLTNDPVYVYPHSSYGTLTGSGFNEGQQAMPLGTTLGGWHATFDEPQGMYCKFQLANDVDHYGRLLNVFMCNSSFGEEMSLELQHVEALQKSTGPGFMFRANVPSHGQERMESYTGDLVHGQEYEVYVTWNKMTSADGNGRPRRYDITIAHRKTDGGEWVVDTSPAQQVNYNSDGTTTDLNTLEMFNNSSTEINGRTSSYHRRTSSALTFGIWNWDGATNSTIGNGTLKEVKLYNDYISSPSFFDSQHWQPTSTIKSTTTRYLRYKATDEAGNETPNTDDHYLTIYVDPLPIYTNATGVTNTATTITRSGNFATWNGWNPAEDWSFRFKAYKASSSSYISYFFFSDALNTYANLAAMDWNGSNQLRLFWRVNGTDSTTHKLQVDSPAQSEYVEVLFAYSSSDYTHDGGGSDPDLGAGLRWYVRSGTSSSARATASWTEVTSTPAEDTFDEGDDITWPSDSDLRLGGGSTSDSTIELNSSTRQGSITHVELWNVTRSTSDVYQW